jgi:hypothetical protein
VQKYIRGLEEKVKEAPDELSDLREIAQEQAITVDPHAALKERMGIYGLDRREISL